MIAIVNQGKKLKGKTLYHMYINKDLLCKFTHSRQDGLAQCLRKAADAWEEQHNKNLNEIYQKLNSLKEEN